MFSHRVHREHRDEEPGGRPYAATRWPLCALWLSSSVFVKLDHREGEEQRPMDNERPTTFKLALPILTPPTPPRLHSGTFGTRCAREEITALVERRK
jgi:hypothetical protein